MSTKTPNQKIIFGLKVRQLRSKKQLSFKELAETSGLSISYLNEIEKGKKYPKEDKVRLLAEALGVSFEQLNSPELPAQLAPVGELLHSNFLNELPLELFGIELSKVVEIIANSPLEVGAFISTLVELSQNYALREENFYHGALRAYQELHYNYFEEIEDAADRFVKLYGLPLDGPVSTQLLMTILKERFGYKIIEDGLQNYPDLQRHRSVYVPKTKKLFMNSGLNTHQRAFQFGKELGFHFLDLKKRSNTATLLRANSFELVLNHFKAAYFAVAILINKTSFIKDLQQFFSKTHWNGVGFLDLMNKYQASPEMMFLRLTNVIPKFFGLNKLFFLRFFHNPAEGKFRINKEMHLYKKHHPHGNQIGEHYCRRWMSLSLLSELSQMQQQGKYAGTIVGAQRSHYFKTDDEYLCFTLARPGYPTPNINISVTIGILIDEDLKNKIKFWNDPAIPKRQVNKTCERCAIADCEERGAPASVIEKKAARNRVKEALRKILDE